MNVLINKNKYMTILKIHYILHTSNIIEGATIQMAAFKAKAFSYNVEDHMLDLLSTC